MLFSWVTSKLCSLFTGSLWDLTFTFLHSFELLFHCSSLPTQTHLAFLFRTMTTGQPEYYDYSLKGMLDAVHGPCQLISQFSRNMQRPVCNSGVLSQTKTQPSLSLEVCCAMLAKCHQESCHLKLWSSQNISNNSKTGMEKALKALRSHALKSPSSLTVVRALGPLLVLQFNETTLRIIFLWKSRRNEKHIKVFQTFTEHPYRSLVLARFSLSLSRTLRSYQLTSHTCLCFQWRHQHIPCLMKMQIRPPLHNVNCVVLCISRTAYMRASSIYRYRYPKEMFL